MVFAILALSPNAESKVFRNAYISFEIPDNWKCQLEQTEWVCRPDPDQYPKESKEAIVILTAKEVGPTDSIPLYENHLNNPILMTGRGGTPIPSKVQYKAKKVLVNDQEWVDGLHLGSEVPNYFTRYYASIKDKIAILVTFSTHQSFYAKYSGDIFKAIQSMRVIASKNLLARPEMGPLRPGSETIGTSIAQHLPADMNSQEAPTEGKSSSMPIYIGLALILAALGIYFWKKS